MMNMIFSSFKGLFFSGLIVAGLTSSAAFGQGIAVDPALEVSKVAYAGMQGAIDLIKAFEKAHGKLPQDEFVGFHVGKEDKEYEVGVYHLVSPTSLATDIYGCHFHYEEDGSIENAHCHDEEEQTLNDYTPAPRAFKIAEFQAGLVTAVNYYKAEHGDPEAITDLKMWHGKSALEFRMIAGDTTTFVMCHYHGDHMDCHGRGRPGKFEPKDAFYYAD